MVGAGVIGLSTAVVALRAGFDVTVISDRDPLETTSAKAAASFKPHDVAINELASMTLERSWDAFGRIERDAGPGVSGVRMHTHWEAHSRELLRPWYADVVRDARYREFPDVPGGYAVGWAYETYFVDMPVYLHWLSAQVLELGGEILVGPRVVGRDEFEALPGDVLFNCTGFGSRTLFGDAALVPVKGQVVVVPPEPAMDWSISADGFYVYPRSGETVLGGTVERGVNDELVDNAAIELIVRGNRRVLPHLEPAVAVRAYAGIRPYRQGSIRIERDPDAPRIVHVYGHGGAGITLSWGSAEAAVALL